MGQLFGGMGGGAGKAGKADAVAEMFGDLGEEMAGGDTGFGAGAMKDFQQGLAKGGLRSVMGGIGRKMIGAMQAVKTWQEKIATEGASVFEATRTPMEKFESRITQLDTLLRTKAITWETYGRAVRNAREELEATAKTGGGYAQAFDSNLISMGGPRGPAQPVMAGAGVAPGQDAKALVAETKKQTTLLERIDAQLGRREGLK